MTLTELTANSIGIKTAVEADTLTKGFNILEKCYHRHYAVCLTMAHRIEKLPTPKKQAAKNHLDFDYQNRVLPQIFYKI
ncbi:MAG: hypothetical protein JXR44_00790 [Thiotrichales bacterium]|nr:hypothetical protein [Thiotrichales bacterium]